jgi:hypothetical protein
MDRTFKPATPEELARRGVGAPARPKKPARKPEPDVDPTPEPESDTATPAEE